MGINSVQYGNVSAERGAQFVRFTEKIAADENAIIGKILNGTITTEEQRAAEYFKVTNQTFEVLPDEYRQLANKKNKTPAEIQKMKDMYKNGFLNFGASYIEHIDNEYGNNDDKLTVDEFVKSLQFVRYAPTLGGVRTTFQQPVFSSHAHMPDAERRAMGITPGMFRISVGIEDPDDLINEFNNALKAFD